jgi:hypothetical protein
MALGTVVGSPVARLGEALLDRDFDLRGDNPVEVVASEGLHEGSHISSDPVGGSVIAGLSVQMGPNSMGVGIYL